MNGSKSQDCAKEQRVAQCMAWNSILEWAPLFREIVPLGEIVNIVTEDCHDPRVCERRCWLIRLWELT